MWYAERSSAAGLRSAYHISNVQVLDFACVFGDEELARLDFLAHENGERLVGSDGVIEQHLADEASLRIHRRLPQLLRIHLSKTLVLLDRVAVADLRDRGVAFFLAIAVDELLALLHLVKRRLRDEEVALFDELRHVAEEER